MKNSLLMLAVCWVGLGVLWSEADITAKAQPFRLETRESFGGRLAYSQTPISATANGVTTGVVTGAGAAGRFTIWNGEASAPVWDTVPQPNGWYDLTLSAGTNGATSRVAVLNGPGVRVRQGMLSDDITWYSDDVQVVRHWVVVPSGKTLTIASGTIVKFCDGTGIQVNQGGTVNVTGAVLTHIADDTAGGDTNMDGAQTRPLSDQWRIAGTGAVNIDGSTDMRWQTQAVTAGTLATGQTTWLGNRVYLVSGDLTVASGATLTVQPGAVVKFAAGVSLIVNSGGTLNAVGNRAQPIFFTSDEDDSISGDTNGDGAGTLPKAGDWRQLLINGGTANLTHVRIYWCGAVNNEGGLNVASGTATLDCGIISHTQFEAVRVSGGTFLAKNSVLSDASAALRLAGGTSTIINCVVADAAKAVRGNCGTLVNCAFANIAIGFEELGPAVYKSCAFYNPPGCGPQSCSQTGANGNIWCDPRFADKANGDYRLLTGSPLIDAGDGTAAPETDFYGQIRVDAHSVSDTGVATTNSVCPDIGIYEFCDPNDVVGLLGIGNRYTQRFVLPGQWMEYTIYFENASTASTAAREVCVTNPLSACLDWSTFEMGAVAFNHQVDAGLSGKQSGQCEVALDGTLFAVRTELFVDQATGIANWHLRIVDPVTADTWPADPQAGFLPPNDEKHRGEGYLSYRVKVRADAPYGFAFSNAATIVINHREPIATNPSWWNTIVTSVTVSFSAAEGGGLTNRVQIFGSSYGTLPAPVRSGYAFAGWWTGDGGTGTQVTNNALVTATTDQTLYAKWTAETYTVTFDAGGGSVNPQTKAVTFDAPYGTLPTPVRTGYTFLEWRGTTNGVTFEVEADTAVRIASAHVLTASWEANTYKLTFDPNGGQVAPTFKSVTYGSGYGLIPIPTRTGYTFGGWWRGAGGTGTQVAEATTVAVASDHTVYAKWTATCYTVTFDAQGGTVSPASKSVAYRSSFGSLPSPARTGHTFGGWWTGAGGTGTQVTEAVTLSSASDQTLFAKWTINRYTLTYSAGTNGTVRGTLTQTVTFGENGSAVEAVADTGLLFSGWSDGRIDNPRTDENVAGDVSVTALFNGVAFTNDSVVVSETAGTVTLAVRGGVAGFTCSVAYWLVPGTATAGSDYMPPKAMPQRIAWTNEVGVKTISIPIMADAVVEDDETFYVLLGSPTNCVMGEPKVCKVTITDANTTATLADVLDSTLAWTTGGAAAWVPQSAVTHDSVDAAASGAMASNKVSYVQTSVTGTGLLSYAWSVVGKGTLRFYDGTTLLAAVTNDSAWQTLAWIVMPSMTHVLKWEFTQGGDTNSRAYLDQVVWQPGNKPGVDVTAVANTPLGGVVSGTGVYYAGAKVSLNAKQRPGWLFTGWTPTNLFAKPLTATQTLTVSNSAITVTANFSKVPVVTGLPNPPEGGTVTGSGLCLPGKSVTLNTTTAKNWWFMGWSDGAKTASRSVTAISDVALYAKFKLISQIAVPVIADPGAQSVMVGVPFRLALAVNSECPPTVTVTGLPTGLKFDAASLVISGVPTAVPAGGRATVKVSASNPGGKAADVNFIITVAPLTASAQGTFNGIVYESGDSADTLRGLLSLTVSPVGLLSAKVTAQAGAISFTGASWDTLSNGVFHVTLRTTKSETLVLALDTSMAWNKINLTGTLTGGAFGTNVFTAEGQRNAFLTKTAPDYAAATNTLARYTGYYTVALPPGVVSDAGAAGNVPLGSGYLAVTVKDGGVVTLTGKLADGTVLSGAATLIVKEVGTDDECAFVPLFIPLYSAKGVFSGILQLVPSANASPTDNVASPVEHFVQAWSYPGKSPTASPSQTEDRFALTFGMVGGYYNSVSDLRAYYSNAWIMAQAPGVSNTYVNAKYTTTVDVVHGALPEVRLAFDPKTGVASLPVGKLPVYSTASKSYVYAPTNPAVATFAVTKTTGIFAGKFNVYYEYYDQTLALKLTTVSVSHEGVLTPVRADAETPSGQGFYLVPDTWKSSGAKPVAYPLKRSYGVGVLDEE